MLLYGPLAAHLVYLSRPTWFQPENDLIFINYLQLVSLV